MATMAVAGTGPVSSRPRPAPVLRPRGPRSRFVLDALAGPPRPLGPMPPAVDDPIEGDDSALALYTCYELHYGGLPGVDDGWEWEPSLLGARRELEQDLERALVEMVGARCPVEEGRGADPAGAVERALLELQARPGPSLSSFVLAGGTLEQVRELAVHRSAYQLKEADPHTWAIPRLAGRSKAALVDIQFGEYGDGDPARVHAELFARTLRALDLDDRVGAYVDRLPGVSLSTCNLISLFGLHRRWRGALVGHLALFELCSVVPMGRYRDALVALGYGPDATEFYAAHVEADARHQEVALREMVAGLVADEPDLAADVVFGARSLSALEGRFADHVLRAWRSGRSSLRQPLRAASHRQGSNGGGLAETMLGSH